MVEFEKGHKPSLNAFWEPFSALKTQFFNDSHTQFKKESIFN